VAVNLVGLNPSDLKRGHVLTIPGWLASTSMLDARLRLLAEPARRLRHNTEVSFHTGSAEVTARVRLLEKEEAQPGEITFVQFILEEPLAVVNGDHYVIRSPMDTLGGGTIIEAHPRQRHHRFRQETITSLKIRSEGKVGESLLAILKTKQPQEADQLLSQSNLDPEIARPALESLIQNGEVVAICEDPGRLLFTGDAWKQLVDNILAMTRDYHRKFSLRLGIPKAEISSKLKLKAHFPEFLRKLFEDGLLVEELSLVRLPEHRIKLTPEQQNRLDSYLRQLDLNPCSPSPDVTLEPDLMGLLTDRRQVVNTTTGVVFSAKAYDDMVSRIQAQLQKNGKITIGETRDLLQTSRKYAQAIIEHMDEKKLTKRVGDDHILF
jgi:selenocysteine-specific elongation factor